MFHSKDDFSPPHTPTSRSEWGSSPTARAKRRKVDPWTFLQRSDRTPTALQPSGGNRSLRRDVPRGPLPHGPSATLAFWAFQVCRTHSQPNITNPKHTIKGHFCTKLLRLTHWLVLLFALRPVWLYFSIYVFLRATQFTSERFRICVWGHGTVFYKVFI